jgi:NADPH2:quinone reductase
MFVSFGNSSGPVPPFDAQLLAQKGSLFFTRPTLANYVATPADLDMAAAELFDVIGRGVVRVRPLRVRPPQTFPLSQAADAHRALEGRGTTGSLVLIPD